jgi:hypothetical protein
MKPSRAALTGLVFPIIAVAYFVFQVVGGANPIDWAGITMLLALGAAISIMSYVLFAGLGRS